MVAHCYLLSLVTYVCPIETYGPQELLLHTGTPGGDLSHVSPAPQFQEGFTGFMFWGRCQEQALPTSLTFPPPLPLSLPRLSRRRLRRSTRSLWTSCPSAPRSTWRAWRRCSTSASSTRSRGWPSWRRPCWTSSATSTSLRTKGGSRPLGCFSRRSYPLALTLLHFV